MTSAPNDQFLKAVHAIGPQLAERAAAYDRSGEFVADNYVLLRQHKLMQPSIARF